MTKIEFMLRLNELLEEYCVANPDYENLHEARVIERIDTPKVREGVNVLIDSYLLRKELS